MVKKKIGTVSGYSCNGCDYRRKEEPDVKRHKLEDYILIGEGIFLS